MPVGRLLHLPFDLAATAAECVHQQQQHRGGGDEDKSHCIIRTPRRTAWVGTSQLSPGYLWPSPQPRLLRELIDNPGNEKVQKAVVLEIGRAHV